jgi:predicted ATPase
MVARRRRGSAHRRLEPPRLVSLHVHRYRALARLQLDALSPLTALLGPHGSGKSTVFDVFSFLSECFSVGLTKAWDKRGRFRELRTRGEQGPIVFELRYRETPEDADAIYRLEIDEDGGQPIVAAESLKWRRVERNSPGAPFSILSFKRGKGSVIEGAKPLSKDKRVKHTLDAPDILAVNTLGQLARHPRVAALRRFIGDWYVSYLSIQDARGVPEAGAQERLSRTGDNLANVVQYLQERHPERLAAIFERLAERVPQVERVLSEPLADGRLLLRLKDAPFREPVLAKFASDGTLKMLAYLLVLHDPEPPAFIGVEEPENFLHPRLLRGLADECRDASGRGQLLVTTHSPHFVDGLRPEEVRILYRDEQGHTQARTAADLPKVKAMLEAGGQLGDLWMEGHLGVGDPLVDGGRPRGPQRRR